jgi:glycosyltransferase involved in cell wall biosynthesis
MWKMPTGFPPVRLLLSRPIGAWRNFFPEAAARIREIALAERPAVVQIEHSLLMGYIDAVPAGIGCRTVLSLHNVAFEQYRRMARLDCGIPARVGYRLKSSIMRRAEMGYVRRFDCCVTVSIAESDLLTDLLPPVRPVVIENGVDCTALQPLLPAPPAALLFAGVMDYPPNADAVVFFCRRILPLIRSRVPDVNLFIVGHSPPPRVVALAREPGVAVTGHVEDMRDYYARSSVAIVPLRAGGGTRLKIMESMALGRPVVSTTIGCEGLDVQDNVHLLIADDPTHFAECVVRLLLEPVLRDRISAEARLLVEQRYDWPAIGKRLIAAYSPS